MSSVRFLHLADVHFDTPYRARSAALRSRLREAARTAFARAVDTVLEERLDALLIAGDLFDNDRLTLATEHFLLEQLARLRTAGVPVFYATGNHDPGRPGDRARQLEWPDNVHLFLRPEPESVVLHDREGEPLARVAGAGHASAREARNLAAAFPPAAGDLPAIALLHAWVSGVHDAGGHDRYAACALADLEGKGYDYWALGHIHLRQQAGASPPAHYPGNLQGRHFGETGVKGGLAVELAGGAARTAFRPLAPVRWERVPLGGLETAATVEQFAERARSALESFLKQDAGGTGGSFPAGEEELLIRLEPAGPCPLYRELAEGDEAENLARLEEIIGERLQLLHVEIRLDRLQPPVDWERHRQGPSVVATLLELLAAARSDPDALEALLPEQWAGLPAGGGGRSAVGRAGEAARLDESARSYWQGLLEGLEAEAVARFLKDR